MHKQYTMEDVENFRMQLLAELYNSDNNAWTKEHRNEVRHTLRSAGYTIEELDDKTTRAVK